MHTKKKQTLLLILAMAAVTCAAMVALQHIPDSRATAVAPTTSVKNGPVLLGGRLVQDKIFTGGDGTFTLSLTLTADEMVRAAGVDERNVDLVVVLDRSGSMSGDKMRDAKQALATVVANLTDKDRMALISYSDGVMVHSGLMPATRANRERLAAMVDNVQTGGGTNLGGGLAKGVELLEEADAVGNLGKLILISDGLANQGVVDPNLLGDMAARAVPGEFSVSTVGVGLEFNEYLMTTLADRGAGTYHYLETPAGFAQVFLKEVHSLRSVAATGVQVRVPLPQGVSLVDAAGFPIEVSGGVAGFRPGDLRAGQTRSLHLTFHVDPGRVESYSLSGLSVLYVHDDTPFTVTLDEPFTVAMVQDERLALSSIDKAVWEEKVIQEDYNKLKEDVARDLKDGDEQAALKKIEDYEAHNRMANESVQSQAVTDNLDQDVGALRAQVEDTFTGSASEQEYKQKANSKMIQQEGYRERRDK